MVLITFYYGYINKKLSWKSYIVKSFSETELTCHKRGHCLCSYYDISFSSKAYTEYSCPKLGSKRSVIETLGDSSI